MPLPSPPALHPPLAEAWALSLAPDFVDLPPIGRGQRLVVAFGSRLAFLRGDDGHLDQTRIFPAPITNLVGASWGVAVAYDDPDHSHLTALTWDGQEQWHHDEPWGLGSEALHSSDEWVVAAGSSLLRNGRRIARALNPQSGAPSIEFDCPGDTPEPTGDAFLFSVVAPHASAGLYQVSLDGQAVRLTAHPHTVRVIAEPYVVYDTLSRDRQESELVAIHRPSHSIRWRCRGGPNLHLGADDAQVSAVERTGPGTFRLSLRDLPSGKPAWCTKDLTGRTAATQLTPDCVLLCVDGRRTELRDRSHGGLLQILDQPSAFVRGGTLTPCGLVDSFAGRLTCFRGTP